MDQSEFQRLAAAGFNHIPLTRATFADLDTPLSAYLKLAANPFSYLLESVQGGERFGRFSFIGLASRSRIVVRGRSVSVFAGDAVVEQYGDINPLDFLQTYLARFKAPHLPHLPRFCGGLVGVFGYDTVRAIEPRLLRAAVKPPSPQLADMPDMLLLLSEEIAIVDNLSGKLTLVVFADPRLKNAWEKAQARLNELADKLRQPLHPPHPTIAPSTAAVSEWGEAAFKAAVRRAKQYIIDGDIMQVVLSQRLSRPFAASPLALYRSLRSLNPSPYMFYFDLADFHVVGASPEILVRLEGEVVTARPIAGTRRRGATAQEDAQLAAELLADPKECAEHLQLLDLGRNDVGRVAAVGSVQVTEKYVIERYSHVMHIVSNIEGRLKSGENAISVLKAAFPAGTVSGAPKLRAMEIIDELEPSGRGLYAGAAGYLGFNGDMDLAISIRTAVLKDGQIFVQAGAGIVADSDADAEWAETQNKARALLRAAELAEAGLGDS